MLSSEQCSYKPKNRRDCREPQKLDKERQYPNVESLEGEWPCSHLDFEYLVSRIGGE